MSKSSAITPDEKIIELLQRNDQKVIQLIYERYSHNLFNIIYRVVKNQSMAQDVFQEVMVKVWKKGHYYERSKGSLYTWLVSVCRNAAIDKTRSREFIKAMNTASPEEFVERNEHSEQKVEKQEQVQEMLRHLPEKQKLIVDMAYLQGYTQEEISKKLDIPLGTVKTRIRLALKHLRNIVQT
ncbi:MAG: RNA polymerase sigma factor [Bacteroidota bacterium]